MNANQIHTAMNLLNVLIGSLLTFNWAAFGLSDHTVTLVMGVLLMLGNLMKVAMTATGNGSNALVADPKKVEETKIQAAVQGTPPT